ncbi:MAG: thioredoxin domain-containing protein [Bacteroidota bacterium]
MKTIISKTALIISIILTAQISISQVSKDSATIKGSLSVNDFEAKLNATKDAQLIDVRTPDEYNSGHLKDAINMDYWAKDFEQKLTELDPSKHTFVYCLAGTRSLKAMQMMKKAGFSTVNYLEGGIMKWRVNDKPVTESATSPTGIGIKESDYEALIKNGKLVLVDVYAVWCPPCKEMAPIVEQLSNELKDKLQVQKINFDTNKPLAKSLRVESFPTFIMYKNGKQVWRSEGKMDKAALRLVIDRYL